MNAMELTLMEWKKASLYGMLAQHYALSNRDLHEHYQYLYSASLHKLAESIATYGDPFAEQSFPGSIPHIPGTLAASTGYPGFNDIFPFPEHTAFPGKYMGPASTFNSLGQTHYTGKSSGYAASSQTPPSNANYAQAEPNKAIPIEDPPQPAFLRILHVSPNTEPIDVYASGVLLASSLAYREVTDYMDVSPGGCTFHLANSGNKIVQLTDEFSLESGCAYTAAAGKVGEEMRLYLLRDDVDPIDGYAKARYVHLAPHVEHTDLIVRDGGTLFRSVGFAEASSYVTLSPRITDLQITPAGSSSPLLEPENISFNGGTNTTVVSIGLQGGTPPLETIVLRDA